MNRVLIALIAAAMGCTPSDGTTTDTTNTTDKSPTETDEPVGIPIEVGTGSTAFQSLTELDDVTMYYGPQGGYHLVGGFRVCSTTSMLRVNFKIVDETTGESIAGEGGDGVDYNVVALSDPEEGCWQFYDMFGYLVNLDGLESTELHEFMPGRVVEYQFTITDTDDNEASGKKRVTVSCGPNAECDPASVEDDTATTGR